MEESRNQRQKLMMGLAQIFEGVDKFTPVVKAVNDKVLLTEHPFGLDVKDVENGLGKVDKIWALGYPGYTDKSVSLMITHICLGIAENPTEGARPYRLRIIFLRRSNIPETHDIFFEVHNNFGIFICGGCTDCSGAGIRGKTTLEGIFELLNVVYGTEIERVTIPQHKAEKMQIELETFINCEYQARDRE